MQHTDPESTPARGRELQGPAEKRRPYVCPALERLGPWRALTLQQSVPISFLWDRGNLDDAGV